MKLSNLPFWNNIRETIEVYHLNFLKELIGKEFLSPKEIDLIEKHFGKEGEKKKLCLLDKIYIFGHLNAKNKQESYSIQFKDYLKDLESESYLRYGRPPKKEDIENLKKQAYLDVLSREYKIEKDIKQHILNEEAKDLEESLSKGKIKKIANLIINNFTNWTSDIKSSISYISQSVLNRGIADSILENSEETDPLVYFIVHPDACKHCRALYLKPSGSPKIFKLKELAAAGSNMSLKAVDWKPTVLSIHPNCRCQMQYLPQGYTWNQEKEEFKKETI